MFRTSLRSARQFSTTSSNKFAKMSLIGTIGSDIEKKTTTTGKEFARYSIAVNPRTKGEQPTSWYQVACFNPAQINFLTSYLGKGAKVFVEADVSNTPYEKEDGSKATSLMLFQTSIEPIFYPKKEGEEA